MNHFDRRAFLKMGAVQLFGFLSYGDALRLRAQSPLPAKRDISIIHLWLTGGMSQLDTFDPKPEADSRYRSLFKPIETNVSGIRVSEHLPLTARHGDSRRRSDQASLQPTSLRRDYTKADLDRYAIGDR